VVLIKRGSYSIYLESLCQLGTEPLPTLTYSVDWEVLQEDEESLVCFGSLMIATVCEVETLCLVAELASVQTSSSQRNIYPITYTCLREPSEESFI
jgi:hypothetical protein